MNRATLRSQINRIRNTLRRILHEDTTLAERIWHPVSWAINYHRIDSNSNRHGDFDPCACAHRRWGKSAGAGSQATWQEWFKRVGKKHLQALGRAVANLAGKAAAALPGIIGSFVSRFLSTLGKTATWLTENLWALAIAVGPCFSWLLGTG